MPRTADIIMDGHLVTEYSTGYMARPHTQTLNALTLRT